MEKEEVKPWKYNPSAWSQRVSVAFIGSIAFFISIYLALFQWGILKTVWDPIFDEGTKNVLLSDVSHTITSWILLPDATLGALAYLGDILYALAGSTKRWQCRPWLVILFGFTVIPLGIVSFILVILQGTVVGSWCFLCLVSAVISLILILYAYDEVISCCLYLFEVYTTSKSIRILWNTFLGRASEEAFEAGKKIYRKRYEKKYRTPYVGEDF